MAELNSTTIKFNIKGIGTDHDITLVPEGALFEEMYENNKKYYVLVSFSLNGELLCLRLRGQNTESWADNFLKMVKKVVPDPFSLAKDGAKHELKSRDPKQVIKGGLVGLVIGMGLDTLVSGLDELNNSIKKKNEVIEGYYNLKGKLIYYGRKEFWTI